MLYNSGALITARLGKGDNGDAYVNNFNGVYHTMKMKCYEENRDLYLCRIVAFDKEAGSSWDFYSSDELFPLFQPDGNDTVYNQNDIVFARVMRGELDNNNKVWVKAYIVGSDTDDGFFPIISERGNQYLVTRRNLSKKYI